MPKLGFARLLAALTAVGIAAFASPAWANTPIDINPGNVPTTAAAFSPEDQECSANLGGGPYADKDVWVFNLPSQAGEAGVFVSVTATFNTPGGVQVKTIPTDGGAIVLLGTSKAWIALDAGWTLTGATAEITGTANFFVLTHTCPASSSTSPSPSPSPSASPSTDPSASPDPSSPPASPSADPSSPAGSPSTSPSSSQPPLPRTGAAVLSMLVAGGAAITAGAALTWLMRRRRATLTNLDD